MGDRTTTGGQMQCACGHAGVLALTAGCCASSHLECDALVLGLIALQHVLNHLRGSRKRVRQGRSWRVRASLRVRRRRPGAWRSTRAASLVLSRVGGTQSRHRCPLEAQRHDAAPARWRGRTCSLKSCSLPHPRCVRGALVYGAHKARLATHLVDEGLQLVGLHRQQLHHAAHHLLPHARLAVVRQREQAVQVPASAQTHATNSVQRRPRSRVNITSAPHPSPHRAPLCRAHLAATRPCPSPTSPVSPVRRDAHAARCHPPSRPPPAT